MRQKGSGEYTEQIHLHISTSQLAVLRAEAENQHASVATVVRNCIDAVADPEVALKAVLDKRTTPLNRLITDMRRQMDATELDEFDEITLAASDADVNKVQEEWLLRKKALWEGAAPVEVPPDEDLAAKDPYGFTEPGKEQDIEELMAELEDRKT